MTGPFPTEVRARVGAATDIGRRREQNEDAHLVAEVATPEGALVVKPGALVTRRGLVLGVFDGCGGASSGEIASAMAADVVLSSLRESPAEAVADDLGAQLEGALRRAHAALLQRSRADRLHRGMGTTGTVAALVDEHLHVAHVGDSRALLLRRGRLVQISRDQTLLNHLVERGEVFLEEVDELSLKNVVLFVLGVGEDGRLEVDRCSLDLRRGDMLLLATDGIGLLSDAEILDILSSSADPDEASRRLVDAANAAGGHDNVTVVVTRFDGDWLPTASEVDVLMDRRSAGGLAGSRGRSETGGPRGPTLRRRLGAALGELRGDVATLGILGTVVDRALLAIDRVEVALRRGESPKRRKAASPRRAGRRPARRDLSAGSDYDG